MPRTTEQLRRFVLGDTMRQTGVVLVDQVFNSAVNFLIGVALIRGVAATEYGTFVLANTALLLALGFQHAIVVVPMTVLAAKRAGPERVGFVDALAATQLTLWLPASFVVCAVAGIATAAGALEPTLGRLAVATAAAAAIVATREFFRQTFLLFRSPLLMLAIDLLHGVLYLALVWLWVLDSDHPAAAAMAAAGVAAFAAVAAGFALYRRRLGGGARFDFGPLRQAWGLAKWGTPGMLLAWLQNHGFFYLLGAVLGTTAVATVSASRLLLMPIMILITAIEAVLRPRAADWVGRREYARLTRQLLAMTGTALVLSLAFVAFVFVARELIVTVVLRREIDDLDLLLVCWGIVFLAQVVRTNVTVLLQALERFDVLFYLTLVRGVVSYSLGYAGMVLLGAPGILVGLAVGEVVYVATGGVAAQRRLADARR